MRGALPTGALLPANEEDRREITYLTEAIRLQSRLDAAEAEFARVAELKGKAVEEQKRPLE
jgi:hypothetical protein